MNYKTLNFNRRKQLPDSKKERAKKKRQALELPNKQNNVEKEENEENLNLLDQPEISNLWHSFDEINNEQEENEENDEEEDNIIASLDYKILNEESKTPIPVYETMTELELNLNKDVEWRKNKNDQENCNRIVPKNDEKQQQQQGGEKTAQLKKTFLSWLRKPNNAKLYNEILTLNPVLLEKLYTTFRQDLEDTRGASKEALANILDEMGVTYCLKNVEEC
uniref:Uncharacterized protein n=1 Tax=Meloidogyne javanica TaxID=6303 RepID=A0A915LPD6_MELJA